MKINKLKLQNFRLFENEIFKAGSNVNLIVGANAQGKTTLLEAIHLISIGRSLKTKLNKELISFNKNYFFLQAYTSNNLSDLDIKFGFSEKGRKISVNNELKYSLVDFIGKIDSVLLTSDDFTLVTGPPENRRKFLDIQLSQANSNYLFDLKNYHRVLRHRNILLKKRHFNAQELNAWTKELIHYGSAVIMARKTVMIALNKLTNYFLKKISLNSEILEIQYKTSIDGESLSQIKQNFTHLIKKHAPKEQLMRYTLIGPHRDDLLFKLNNIPARKYASKGQLKSIAISLKLAEAYHLKERKNYWPVLLIDDIFSELDHKRQQITVDFFNKKQQIFIAATTNLKHLNFNKNLDIKTCNITNGRFH